MNVQLFSFHVTEATKCVRFYELSNIIRCRTMIEEP